MSVERLKKKHYEIRKETATNFQSESQLINWHLVGILVVNFGFPWLFYVFYINEQMATIFSYVFIVANGTQVCV